MATTLTFTILSGPAHGQLNGAGPGFNYTVDPDYNGDDSFTYKVSDGTVDSNVGTVSIKVNPANDAPVANAQTITPDEDTDAAITLAGSDVDNDALTFNIATQPANGTLSGTAPNLTYTPNANYQRRGQLHLHGERCSTSNPVPRPSRST